MILFFKEISKEKSYIITVIMAVSNIHEVLLCAADCPKYMD